MEKIEWSTGKRRVRDLIPCENNPNVNSEAQFSSLKKNLGGMGYVEIIVVDTDNRIVAGNHRHRALMEMGNADDEIDVRVPNRKLTKEEFDRYLIASNALHGGWSYDILRSFPTELLLDIGLDASELAHIWDDSLEIENDEFDEEQELAAITIPQTKPGDIFALGQHRLICGDATDPEVLKKLFDGEKASMIYSDPLYNLRGGVDYAKGVGGHASYGGNVNDTRTDAEYKEFLRASMENALAVAKDDVHVFYWCDQSYIWLLQQLYRELGIENKRVCLWIKNSQNPTPGVAFSKCYEPCVYGVKGKPYLTKGIDNLNEIQNKEVGTGNRLIDDILDLMDIWLVKRLAGIDYTHATSKPPTLHEKAIRRCTAPGDIILDSFAGSGSTMVAAEQLKRRVFMVELEPAFCDLIIKRYELLTNDHARKIN